MNREWPICPLGSLCTIERGGSPRPIEAFITEDPDGINWIKIGDADNTMYITHTAQRIKPEGMRKSRFVQAGDFLLSNSMSFGRPYILKINGCIHDGWLVLRDEKNTFDKRFLYYLLSAPTTYRRFQSMAVGGVVNNLNSEMVRNLTVPVPSRAIQEEIATRLGMIDSLIGSRSEQLQLIDQLVKSRFIEMFGDLANPACIWPQIKLAEACVDPDAIKCGPFGTQLSKDEYKDSGVAVWEIPQINSHFATQPTHYLTEEKARQLDAYSLKPGDIAMSRKGNVGKCAMFPSTFEAGIIHSDVLRIRVDDSRVSPLFMMHQLHYSGAVQHQIELVSSGAIMAGINVTKLKQIYVHIPPLELQNRFAVFVEQTDKSKLSVQQSIDQLETLKKSLMQKYFG